MKIIYKSAYVFLFGMILATGCKKFDDSINKDPNNPGKAGTQLIANAELYLPDMSSSPYGVHYPQYLSNTSFTDNSRYVTTNFNFYPLYYGPLMNLQNVINNQNLDVNEGPVVNQVAIAKILKAYFFWHITDRWGDVPFTEALAGSANLTPKYDKQSVIYDSLFKLLDEANAAIVTGNIKNDIIYGGDTGKWKRLGNTIHLLMALRLSKVDPQKGKLEFNKALTNGIMTANIDNLAYPHLADKSNENYWFNSFTQLGRNWFAVSKTVVDYMKPLDDPRLPVYANKNTAGNYVGLDYGLPGSVTVVINNYSLLGDAIRRQNSPVYLVTYAQALFAQAEAAKIGWTPDAGDAAAKAKYDLAIEQSVRQWNNNDISGLPLLMSHPEVQYSSALALQQIGYQRWVHLFMHGYEGWAEWRRTGYPALSPAPDNNNTPIPRREGYPTQERANNTANYQAAVSSFPYQGADDLNARVWWDKP